MRHFFSALDIPGKNDFTPKNFYSHGTEEIFVGKQSEVLFNGQPAGMILADSMALANLAAKKVKIIYVDSGSL